MTNVYTPIDSSYKLVFDDEFNGTSLDTSKWTATSGWNIANQVSSPANVSVGGGDMTLTLASASSGSAVDSNYNTFSVPVGAYVEARVYFSGNGSQLYNWPAWWLSGPNWPDAGEHDIAEVLGGRLTVNYHSPSGAHNQGAVPGYWGDAFHVFGIMRNATSADVYWDGNLVASYPTDDNGAGEQMIFDMGSGQGPAAYGATGQLKVDYVHVYENNPNVAAVTPEAGYGGPGDTGDGGTVTPPPPPPPTVTPDKLVLTLSEDRARGTDAQFIAKLDGNQIAGPTSVTSLQSAGSTQDFTYTGTWGSGPHNLEIDFLNDFNNGHNQDRNLYVDQVAYDGANYLAQPDPMYSNGSVNIVVGHA